MLRRFPDGVVPVAGQLLKYRGDDIQQLSCHLTTLISLCAPLTRHFVLRYLSFSGRLNAVSGVNRSTPLEVIRNKNISNN